MNWSEIKRPCSSSACAMRSSYHLRLVGDAPNNNSCSGPPSKSAKSRSSQGCSERGSAKSLWSASALAGNGTTAWEDINAVSSTAPCVAPPTAEAGRGSMLAPMLARFSEFTAKAGAGTEGALTTAEILATKACARGNQ